MGLGARTKRKGDSLNDVLKVWMLGVWGFEVRGCFMSKTWKGKSRIGRGRAGLGKDGAEGVAGSFPKSAAAPAET